MLRYGNRILDKEREMAKIGGKCGSRLDEATGQCPKCGSRPRQDGKGADTLREAYSLCENANVW